VLLTFQTLEEPNPPNRLLNLRLDYSNGSISDVDILSPEATKVNMPTNLRKAWKEMLRLNLNRG
jgi:hypothetical protein